MDLIRTYSEIVFSRVSWQFLTVNEAPKDISGENGFPLKLDLFLDQARIYYPELSDDTLKLLYKLGLDEWSVCGYKDKCDNPNNIFQVLACLATQMLEEHDSYPIVHFKDLFRWREVTQLLGEDLLTCTLLAFNDRDSMHSVNNGSSIDSLRKFDWPSVIHNDNPNLRYLFSRKRLCELHSHLKASTNTFEITWVCLMNHIAGREKQFNKLAQIHIPSEAKEYSRKLYEIITEAANIRFGIYESLTHDISGDSFLWPINHNEADALDRKTEGIRDYIKGLWCPDYIAVDPGTPMSVYEGERNFLYLTLRAIFSRNNQDLTYALYRYVLAKSLFRKYLIQVNNNIGFSNFQRYQDLKGTFLTSKYKELPQSLPLWEAQAHNFTEIFESRVVPIDSIKKLTSQIKHLTKWTNIRTFPDLSEKVSFNGNDWLLIFHFLKRTDSKNNDNIRNITVRDSAKAGSLNLQHLSKVLTNAGMDAASSELACPPEAFGQAFRFLRHFGFDATFHAGEDFYDLADGLRSIDEAITFLELRSSDRIGHALALGINPDRYYASRHYTIALPIQYMLDNSVWLLKKSEEFGITINPSTKSFLIDNYKRLSIEIGYTIDENLTPYDIATYYDSMSLRGDDPQMYNSKGEINTLASCIPGTWAYYSFLHSEKSDYARNNKNVRTLYYLYHDFRLREKGNKVKAFKLPEGYSQLITDLQNAMMKDICKRQLCIECCPSSNLRIGRLERFDQHPIFRFMPVKPDQTRYPLAVTVNTDDLGVFSTSLPNEFSLLALALLKMKDTNGNHIYSTQEVYDWIERVIDNGHKFTFQKESTYSYASVSS